MSAAMKPQTQLKRHVIEKAIASGLSTAEICEMADTTEAYVKDVRKKVGGNRQEPAPPAIYTSREWYEANDRRFKEKLAELAKNGGGW